MVDAILGGSRVSTTALVVEYEVEKEPWPQPGQRWVVVSADDF